MKYVIFFIIFLCQWLSAMEGSENVKSILAKQQKELDTRMWDALKGSQPEKLKEVLAAGANPNQRHDDETWPFEYAIGACDDICAEILFEFGANPNPINFHFQEPLIFDCPITSFSLLIKCGVDLECRNHQGETLMHLVSRYASKEAMHMLEILIQAGADINAQNKKMGNTPLLEAIDHDNEAACALLLNAGADPYIRNNWGKYAWKLAQDKIKNWYKSGEISRKCKEMLEAHDQKTTNLLPRMQEIDELNEKLFQAIMERRAKKVERLIKRGALPEARDWKDRLKSYDTPLMCAARLGRYKICKYLIDAGASIHTANERDETALHFAAQGGNILLITLFIQLGANLNACAGISPMTPLMRAVCAQKRRAAALLLEAGADLHITRYDFTQYENNALNYAAWYQDRGMCEMLLAHQEKLEKGLIVGLWCIKKLGEQNLLLKFLYNERVKLLYPHLKEYYQTYTRRRLLEQIDEDGHTAYEAFPIECLKIKEIPKK